MNSKYIETLKRHINTHVRSVEDRSAVSYLESVLNPKEGLILLLQVMISGLIM